MPSTKRKPKVIGRPPTTLTPAQWGDVERMAKALCTAQEIADYIGIPKRTLYDGVEIKDKFLALMKKKAAETRLRVREQQLEAALKGNPVGSIWWGKQHLNQTDRNVVQPPEGGPLDQIAGAAQRLNDVLDKLANRQEKAQ